MTGPQGSNPKTDASGVRALNFYLTTSQPCAYLAGREASSIIVDPRATITTPLYGALIDHGFRRSGEHIYRPHCRACSACIPVRVPVTEFHPRRSQKRAWQANQDLTVARVAMDYQSEHFELYRRYQDGRHCGGGMDHPTPRQYMDSMMSLGIDMGLYEFRLGQELLAIAVVDHLPQGLSAVYTFFSIAHPGRSLGTYAVLWQIQEAQRLGLPYVYLGYWIKESPKMNYKNQYRPLEIYRNNQWLQLAGPD